MLPMMSATGEIGIVISLSVWLGFLILSVYVASSCSLTASSVIFQTHLDLLIRWKKEKKKKEKRATLATWKRILKSLILFCSCCYEVGHKVMENDPRILFLTD